MTHRPQDRRLDRRPSFALDSDSLQYWGLLVCLLIGYALLVYTVVSTLVLMGLGYDADIPNPRWLDGVVITTIAIGFVPAQRWLAVRVGDLVYGEYDNPYPLLSQLNVHLQRMTSPAATLPMLAATIATTLRLPYVGIEAIADDMGALEADSRHAFGRPPAAGDLVRLPIIHLGQPVGTLLVATRKPDRPLSASDMALLHDIGRQIGVALYALRLTFELEEALSRLVRVREAERRRIRNDLHDGLGPALSAIQLQLGGVRRLLRSDPAAAEGLIDELKSELRLVTADIRRLVHDLRPPLLDELGLVGALRDALQQDAALMTELRLLTPLPELPAALEVAIYRIVQEALHNVRQHAAATHCTVTLARVDGQIELRVCDNGVGLPAALHHGVGLNSIRQRAEELGGHSVLQNGPDGGAQLAVRLPLRGM